MADGIDWSRLPAVDSVVTFEAPNGKRITARVLSHHPDGTFGAALCRVRPEQIVVWSDPHD